MMFGQIDAVVHINTKRLIELCENTHSHNLSRWVRGHSKRYSLPIFAAYSPFCAIENMKVARDEKKTQCSHIFLGFGGLDGGYLHGSRLSEILCLGRGAKTWAYPPSFEFSTLEGWIEMYLEKGVQWLDPEEMFYVLPQKVM